MIILYVCKRPLWFILNRNNLFMSSQTNIITSPGCAHVLRSKHISYKSQKGLNEYCYYIILILRYDDVMRSYILNICNMYVYKGSALLEHRRLRSLIITIFRPSCYYMSVNSLQDRVARRRRWRMLPRCVCVHIIIIL